MKKFVLITFVLVVALSLVIPASLVAANLDGTEAGIWHLDEGSGVTAGDSSSKGNHGIVNGANWVAGKYGSALSFDGVNDYVQLPKSNLILNVDDFTVFTWFKTAYNHPVYGSGEGRMVNLHRLNPDNTSTSALALYLEQGIVGLLYHNGATHFWIKHNTVYYDDNWHSVAVTHGNNVYRLYYDGIEVKTQADEFGDFGVGNAYLGTYNSAERFYKGLLDEVGIWSRALSAQEIAALNNPVTHMAKFEIKRAYINFTDEEEEDRINVQGMMALGNGNGVNISEGVKVNIGTLTETITMEDRGKKEKMWVYNRPQNNTSNIKHMTINWKSGEFTICIDRADLSGMVNPDAVMIGIIIGDDVGSTIIDMREKKQWLYPERGNNH